MSLFGASSTFGGGGGPSQSSFGQTQNNNTQTPQSLFSLSTPNQTSNQSTSLLGGQSTNQNQNSNQPTSLFGGQSTNQNQNQNQTQGFGNQPSNQSTSLFGGQSTTTQNQNQAFGTQQSTNQQQQSQPQQQQNLLSSNLASGLGASTTNGAIAESQLRELAAQRLREHGLRHEPREKTIPEQLESLVRKWDPNSQDTLLQQYLYNSVLPAYAPFHYPKDDESHAAWEEALANKPSTKSAEGEDLGCAWVPVLCRGFKSLGERVELQTHAVNSMRMRIHEINNSLTAVMEKHRQDFTVALEGARRQHTNLAERTLRLAVKVQVLRNRGYALTSGEEVLRKQLLELQGRVLDPGFAAREEEIWARMVALRERARWLEEEGKRVGDKVAEQGQDAKGLPEYVVAKTKKILRDYDEQIAHLAKELEAVKKEHLDWQESRRQF